MDSPFIDDNYVRDVFWYHTTTHVAWPDQSFDPASTLDDLTKRRMESQTGSGAVERWASRQKTKALHVGSYEAAIENMFRRIHNQDGSGGQFYLFRIVLDRSCRIAPGLHLDRMGLMGDVQLSDLCEPPLNVYRYVNEHEDVSGVSLALNSDAIYKVQKIAVPVPIADQNAVAEEYRAELERGVNDEPSEGADPLSQIRARVLTKEVRKQQHIRSVANRLTRSVADELPWSPGRDFSLDLAGNSQEEIESFVLKLEGLRLLVSTSDSVLDNLTTQPWRIFDSTS